ncbi:unknown [Phocaeicola coprophilus CAG:333]|nr:unknown [Phocaeicola coprophilus CAG:333]
MKNQVLWITGLNNVKYTCFYVKYTCLYGKYH